MVEYISSEGLVFNDFYSKILDKVGQSDKCCIICPNYSGTTAKALLDNCSEYEGNYTVIIADGVLHKFLNTFTFNNLDYVKRLLKSNNKIIGYYDSTNFSYPKYLAHSQRSLSNSLLLKLSASEEAIQLERNRNIGRDYFSKVLYVPDCYTVSSVEDAKNIPEGRYAVKYIEGSFIDYMDKQAIEQRASALLSNGSFNVEFYVDGYDISLGFLCNNGCIVPTVITEECNRLFPNGSGSKMGTVYAKHTVYTKHPLFSELKPLIDKAISYYKKNPIDINGWLDIDLRYNGTHFYFIECMVRGGISNFTTILHQLDENYFDLLLNLNTHTKIKWKDNVSTSVELFSINFSLNSPTSYTFDIPRLSDNVYFDPLEFTSMKSPIGKVTIEGNIGSTQRVGVLSMIGNFPSEAKSDFLTLTSLIENCCWRLPEDVWK